MRFLASAKTAVQPFALTIATHLNTKLVAVAKNPSRPFFNHFLFESIACTIK